MKDESEQEQELVFRYSRSDRLKRADEAVRSLNEPRSAKKPTLFGTLTANKSLAFLFLAIIMLSATALVSNFLIPDPNEKEYKGNRFIFTAFQFEGSSYVAIKKKRLKADAFFGPARLFIRVGDSKTFSLSEEIALSDRSEEEFKYKISISGDKLEAVLNIGDAILVLKTKTQ